MKTFVTPQPLITYSKIIGTRERQEDAALKISTRIAITLHEGLVYEAAGIGTLILAERFRWNRLASKQHDHDRRQNQYCYPFFAHADSPESIYKMFMQALTPTESQARRCAVLHRE